MCEVGGHEAVGLGALVTARRNVGRRRFLQAARATCSCTTLAFSAYFVADTGTMQPEAQLLYMTNPESWGRVYLCVTARPPPTPPRILVVLPANVHGSSSQSLLGNLQPVYIRWVIKMLGCVLTHLRTSDLESYWGVGVRVHCGSFSSMLPKKQ